MIHANEKGLPKYCILAIFLILCKVFNLIFSRHRDIQPMKESANTSSSHVTKYIACWIPLMAQHDLRLINGIRMSRFHATAGSATYRITTTIVRETIPKIINYQRNQRKKYVGLTILVTIVPYEVITPHIFDWIKWVRRIRGNEIGGRILRVHKDKYHSIHNRTLWEQIFRRRRVCLKSIRNVQKCKLVLIDYLSCGLAEFKLESDHEIQTDVRDYIMHQLIMSFHEHHYHETHFIANKSLQLDTPEVLNDNNNVILANYLGSFTKYIEESIDGIYADYHSVDIPRSKRRFIERFYISSTKEKQFYEACHDILGVLVFLSSLLNSQQNTHWKLDAHPQTDLEKFRFEEAMILENAKQGVTALLNKVRYHHDRRDYRWATIIGIAGLIVGVCSIILTLSSQQVRQDIKTGWNNIWSNICDGMINVWSYLSNLIINAWDWIQSIIS